MLKLIYTILYLSLLLYSVSFSGLRSVGSRKTLLTQDFDDLTSLLEGSGRAKIFWENLRQGIDPSVDLGPSGLSERVRWHMDRILLKGRPLIPLESVEETLSSCGTRKILFQLQDTQKIESVLIPSYKHDRTTLCVSTQIGCDRGCRFCLTGKMGLSRNLTASEIVGQAIHGIRISTRESMPKMTNLVFMGMGDAGRNIDQVHEAVECLIDRKRISMAQSKITVSTVGPSPEAFMRLAAVPATLAWSLHSADDKIRKFLVPSTKHSTVELRDCLRAALLTRPLRARKLMIAITLIDGINDSMEDAMKIAAFVRPMLEVAPKIALDLIPYNDISVPGFSRPSTQKVNDFQRHLRDQGFFCSVRITRGDEESSACGMLATKRVKPLKDLSIDSYAQGM